MIRILLYSFICIQLLLQTIAVAQSSLYIRKGELDSNRQYVDTTFKKIQRFEREIRQIETQFNSENNEKGGLLFLGSSSIRLWKTLADDFQYTKVYNRGFGGATIPEILHYFGRLTQGIQPDAIIIYAGENDLAFLKADVYQTKVSFKKLLEAVFHKYHKIPTYIISIKPSPKRWIYQSVFIEFNQFMKELSSQISHLYYINVVDSMVINQLPRTDLFVRDSLHMNEIGYQIWRNCVQSALTSQGTKIVPSPK